MPTAWNAFRHAHRGQGYSMKELSQMYRAQNCSGSTRGDHGNRHAKRGTYRPCRGNTVVINGQCHEVVRKCAGGRKMGSDGTCHQERQRAASRATSPPPRSYVSELSAVSSTGVSESLKGVPPRRSGQSLDDHFLEWMRTIATPSDPSIVRVYIDRNEPPENFTPSRGSPMTLHVTFWYSSLVDDTRPHYVQVRKTSPQTLNSGEWFTLKDPADYHLIGRYLVNHSMG